MKNEGEKEEAVQDMLALAFIGYKSLVDRQLYDNIYSTPLGDYSIRSFFAGRRSYGQSSTDVTSDRCIKLRRARTKEIFRYNYRKHCWTEIDIYDPEPLVDWQSDLLMDFENWLETLSPQERKVADLLLEENRCWLIIQDDGRARMKKGWWYGLFIPIYNVYVFCMGITGLGKDMNTYCDSNEVDTDCRISENYATIVWAIMFVPLINTLLFPLLLIPLLNSYCRLAAEIQDARIRKEKGERPKTSGHRIIKREKNIVFPIIIGFILVYIAIGAIWIGGAAAQSARQAQCSNHLRKIILGFHFYHEAHGALPPLYTVDENGRPLHSWRVLLLPYIEQGEFYEQIRLNEPWDSPHNKQFHDKIIDIYRCPSNKIVKGNKNCCYSVIAGEAFVPAEEFGIRTGLHLSKIEDGTSNTIALVEVKEPFCWMDPMSDVTLKDMSQGINSKDGRIGGSHSGGINCALLDGSIRFFPNNTDIEKFTTFGTIDGHGVQTSGPFFRVAE